MIHIKHILLLFGALLVFSSSQAAKGRFRADRYVLTYKPLPGGKGRPNWPKRTQVLHDDGKRAIALMHPDDVKKWTAPAGAKLERDVPISHTQQVVQTANLLDKATIAGYAPPSTMWQYQPAENFSAWHATSSPASTGTVRVALLDSGIPCAPAKAQAVPSSNFASTSYDFVSDPLLSLDGDGRDSDPTDPGDSGLNCPTSSWHGLQTAATVYNASHNPNVKIQPIRVLGQCGTGYASDLADAVTWAAGGSVSGVSGTNPTPAHVILLAVSGVGSCPSYLQSAITFANSTGVTVVAAAGNNADSSANYFPGNCAGVISVTASTRGGNITWYGNRKATIALAGGDETDPLMGVGIDPATGNAKPIGVMGTSFSAAIFAGLTAFNSTDSTVNSYLVVSSYASTSSLCYPNATVCSKYGIASMATTSSPWLSGADIDPNLVSVSTGITGDYLRASLCTGAQCLGAIVWRRY